MTESKIPEPVRALGGEVLRALSRVGSRAIGAALKSAAADGRKVAKKADTKLRKFAEGIDELTRDPDDADENDEARR